MRGFAAGALALALAAGAVPAAADCAPEIAAFNRAQAARDLAAIAAAADRIGREPACPAETRAQVDRQAALLHVAAAQRLAAAGATLEARSAVLEAGFRFARPWELLASWGEVTYAQRRFLRAAELFQLALNEIDDAGTTPQAPPPATIRRIAAFAQQAVSLAAQPVQTPRTRSGNLGGLALARVRNIAIERVAFPIQFVRAEDRMTEFGERSARTLLEILLEQRPASVRLVGHTDPDGSDDYNLGLSRRRAEAVASYLRANGYGGEIRTEGRGEREPLQVDNSLLQHSQPELYQMLRRVELVRE